MNTILDVAKKAGVSAMTVSRYFNQPDMLAPTTRERVCEAIEQLQYVPNAAARSLVSGRTNTVALILSDITNPFYTPGAHDVLISLGLASATQEVRPQMLTLTFALTT